jgi:hypothetical protein
MNATDTAGLITFAYHARGSLGVIRAECEKAGRLLSATVAAEAMEHTTRLIDILTEDFARQATQLPSGDNNEPI